MYIPGFGDVSTPASTAAALAKNPGTGTRTRPLGPLAGPGWPGFQKTVNTDKDRPGSTAPTNEAKEDPTPYGNKAKALSAEAIRALGMKRSAADQAYQAALAGESAGIGRFRASFNAAKQKIERAARNSTEDLARKLAGRGTARSPMFMGRGIRGIESQVTDRIGEAQFTLTTEIEALKQATEQARLERDQILADIELEEALMRTNPELYYNR